VNREMLSRGVRLCDCAGASSHFGSGLARGWFWLELLLFGSDSLAVRF